MQLIKHIWFQKSRASLPFASNFATFRVSMHELGYQKGRIIKHNNNNNNNTIYYSKYFSIEFTAKTKQMQFCHFSNIMFIATTS